MAPRRRLACVTAHLQGAALRRPRTASVAAEPDPKPLLLDDREMKEFIKSGVHMIPPGSPGMPDASVLYANWEDACAMQESATAGVHSIADNVISSVPGVRDVLESPAVRGDIATLETLVVETEKQRDLVRVQLAECRTGAADALDACAEGPTLAPAPRQVLAPWKWATAGSVAPAAPRAARGGRFLS